MRVLDIEAASFGSHAWRLEAFEEALENCSDLFFMARASGRIAGYSITCLDRERAELISIAVFPQFRGRGVARALIDATILNLRKRDIRAIWLTVDVRNKDAIALYRRLGFVRLRTVQDYYGKGRNGWRMELLLRSRGG